MEEKSEITTVIFDLSEVYLRGLWGTHEYLNDTHGTTIEEHDFWHMPELKAMFRGEITEEEFWQKSIDRFSLNLTVSQLKEAVRQNFREIEGTKKIIETLKDNGYRLGLLSDHAKEWVAHCETRFDYHKLFHSTLYSFEVETCKPDRKVFEEILKRLGARPKECLFIDDWLPNLIGASKLGINTLLFKSPETLKQDLASIGVNII